MTTPPTPASPGRPNRFQLPNLMAGIVLGVLVAGALAPLVGTDDGPASTAAPDFLAGEPGEVTSAVTGPAGMPDDPGASPLGGASDPAATPGAGSAAPTAAPGAAAPTSDEPRTASDVGVTESTIRIGAMTLNSPGAAALSGTPNDPTPQAVMVKAFVDEVNERGGIHGRKLELVTADYDPVSDFANGGGSERAACLELTRNRKVFAVVMGGTLSNSCIYEEHKTPLLTYADALAAEPEAFNRTEGRIWVQGVSSGRALLDWARQLDRQQLLTKQTKWGVVYGEGYERQSVERTFLPEMKRLGYEPSHVTVYPVDFTATPVKFAQDVPAMRAKGITHVVLATNFAANTFWVRESERNGWHPQYLVSDFPNDVNSLTGSSTAKAGDWRGAIAVSSWREPRMDELQREPASKRCLDIYRKGTGRAVDDVQWPFWYCNGVKIFELAATKAGVNLTRQGFVRALASLGSFPMAGAFNESGSFGGAYAFGPTRWSAKVLAQRKVWTEPCPAHYKDNHGCWVPVGPVYPMAA